MNYILVLQRSRCSSLPRTHGIKSYSCKWRQCDVLYHLLIHDSPMIHCVLLISISHLIALSESFIIALLTGMQRPWSFLWCFPPC